MGIDINTIELYKEKKALCSDIMDSEYDKVRKMLQTYPELIEADLSVPYDQEDADDEDNIFIFTGNTPLYYAVVFSDLKMVQILVEEFGADINKGDNDNGTPLHRLCYNRKEKQEGMLDYLLQKGAEVNVAYYETGKTPLMNAADSGLVDIVQKLLDYGADANAITNYNTNVFSWIVINYTSNYKKEETAKNEEILDSIVKLLVEYGADINYITKGNEHYPTRSPLDIAKKYEEQVVAKVFRKYGAKTVEELLMEYTKEELEDIEYFRNMFKEEWGEPDRKIEASQEVIKKYQDILPEELLYYWKTYGFSSFKDGLLWFINPDDYKELVDEFLAGTQFENKKDLYAIARSAFGTVYLWESKKGNTLIIKSFTNMIFYKADIDRRNLSLKEDNIEINKFISFYPPFLDENDGGNKPLFQRCLKKFGKLEPDEIYAFKLSHFLGGADSIKNIQKANIFNHFSIQKQLKEPHLVISDLEKNILSY